MKQIKRNTQVPENASTDRAYAEYGVAFVLVVLSAGYVSSILTCGVFNVSSRTATIPLRAIVLGISILGILWMMNRHSKAPGLPLLCGALFWLCYLLRVFLSDKSGGWPQDVGFGEMLAYVMGGCFIPMVACFHSISRLRGEKTVWIVSYVGLAGLVLFVYVSLTDVQQVLAKSSGRYQFAYESGSVGALLVSYFAASMVAIGLWLLGTKSIRKTGRSFGLVCTVVLIGLYAVVVGGSRGPVLGLVTVIFILMLGHIVRGKATGMAFLMICASAMVAVFVSIEQTVGGVASERFISIAQSVESQDSSSSRLWIWENTWAQIVRSPIFGESLVVDATGSWPHNLFLEGLLATGVLGGIPLAIFMIAAVIKSWSILASDDPRGWIAVAFIVSFVGQQFSGAIYEASAIWCFGAAVIGAEVKGEIGSIRKKR